jgi:amidohydrolase
MCVFNITRLFTTSCLLVGLITTPLSSIANSLHTQLDQRASAIEDQVIAWRRDFHQHPELANREFRTAKIIAKHLKSLQFDQVQTGIAHTGVVGVLKGGKPGPVVALRAEMDAYLGEEMSNLPFASTVATTHQGKKVKISHNTLGHDAHLAMLMGVAQVLADMRADIPGTVKFIFQPAEESSLIPEGEKGGAGLMIQEGVLENPKPQAIFSLHTHKDLKVGSIGYRRAGMFASSSLLHITLNGTQTYGAYPWKGQDTITTAAQIILALQTIPSRQLDITKAPALISLGQIHAGNLSNVIPGELKMSGIIRALDPDLEREINQRIRTTVTHIAKSAGMQATTAIEKKYPVLYNDPICVDKALPSLERIFDTINTVPPILGGQQFSFFSTKIPGFYFYLGTRNPGDDLDNNIDERGLTYGVRALASLAVDYLVQHSEN